ncbi:asialoglycoprotein receptor 1-like [Protopterus annectens]|uniref:asialoglycoprotein receptor 1-like n=1 Tax=Protopterus annectens TaxID=7888 RepID=UPI001CF9EEC8|nr:asialoglycoprotein receptor 1-like [Protopterus annectens]
MLSNSLYQSIQNLREKDKKCKNLNIRYGNLNEELQKNKGNFADLINNIESVCEGEHHHLKIPDTFLANNLYQSIQNLAEKDKKCKDLNIRNGNLNEELQENKGNFAELINNLEYVCEGNYLRLKITGEQQSNMRKILTRLAEKEKYCTGLKTINENLRKEQSENKQLIGSMKCIPQENYSECCPSDWQMFKHSCYYFSQEYHNWSEAQRQCEIKQSNLVMIKSREQQDFLKSILKYKYWMGLTDADHEKQWKWVDGKPCDCTGKNRLYWYSKEPDNWSSGGSSTDEDCAVIRPDGGWSDIKCTDTERWICEKVTSVCYVNKP